MKKIALLILAAAAITAAAAQTLTPLDPTALYRRSFTARYELIGGEPVREAALSPDSTRVGFVRNNNLFIKDLASGVETRITTDGTRNHIINGATDWVYEEEYLFTRAWEFSPDGHKVAWLRFDESRVPEFTMMMHGTGNYPAPHTFKYPRAGEANSVVSLHVYDLATGESQTIDTGDNPDQYIPRIGWTPGGELFFYRVNRLQNHFEVVLADGRVIYDESSPTYVERPNNKTITFLPDGDRFVVHNETRTGWFHLYLHSIRRGFLGAITSGEWEVTSLDGVDGDRVTYTSTELSPLSRAKYSVHLNGKGKHRLGNEPSAPADGDPRQFFTIPLDGDLSLNAWMLTPEGFDPAEGKKYPVLMTQYSGPGSQSVAFTPISRSDMVIYKPLLDAGIVVVCVDGRGTGGRGEAFKKCTYANLGHIETRDQIAAARHFASQPWVDEARIGIYGWSFGGFIALNAILHGADIFSVAVAVAPVTNWRLYDSIYTEIYNGLPADNAGGYDNNSPTNHAALLRGKLLLIHGSADDNVHVQNTLTMARALIDADRDFDMLIYPDDNHNMMPHSRLQVRHRIADYIIENL